MVGIAFSSFLTGALNGASNIMNERAKQQDEVDKRYQEQLNQFNFQKQLQDARMAEEAKQKEADRIAKFGQGTPKADAMDAQINALMNPQAQAQVNIQSPMALPISQEGSDEIIPLTPELATQPVVLSNEPQGVPQNTTPLQPTQSSPQGSPLPLPNAPQIPTQSDTPQQLPFGIRHPETLAGVQTYLALSKQSGSDIDIKELQDYILKSDKDQDKAKENAPIDEAKLEGNSKVVLDNLRLNGTDPILTPMDKVDKTQARKAVADYSKAGQNSDATIHAVQRLQGINGKFSAGLGIQTLADVETTARSFLGLSSNEQASFIQEFTKDKGLLANELFKSLPPGSRLGAAMYQYESSNLPSLSNTPEANAVIIQSILQTAVANKEIYNAALGASTAAKGTLRASEIDSHVRDYKDANPAFLSDGKTPNPKFMTYKEWIAAGTPDNHPPAQSSEPTSSDNPPSEPVTKSFTYDPATGSFKAQ